MEWARIDSTVMNVLLGLFNPSVFLFHKKAAGVNYQAAFLQDGTEWGPLINNRLCDGAGVAALFHFDGRFA